MYKQNHTYQKYNSIKDDYIKLYSKYKYTPEEINFINNDYKKLCSDKYRYIPAIISPKRRIIVFGDIHGDYNLCVTLFLKAQLIEEHGGKYQWIGGDTYVVQVGDQIDRCRPLSNLPCSKPETTLNDEANDIIIMELFNDLDYQARQVGGAVISLLGNHEIMNVLGHMDYVSYLGFEQFRNYKDPSNSQKTFYDGIDARKHAFKAGNEYAKMMGCSRLPAVVIGSNLFVHAGIVDALIEEIQLNGIADFETINIKIRKWLLGILDQKSVNKIISYSPNSMFWTRNLGNIPPRVDMEDPRCKDNISNVLKMFNISTMFIGHTPMSFNHNDFGGSTCSNRIWRIDNGSSAAFNAYDKSYLQTGTRNEYRTPSYIEILNDSEYNVYH